MNHRWRCALCLLAGLWIGPAAAQTAPDWPAIGRVTWGAVDAPSACTGTLIAPDLVMTAAHCVTTRDTGAPAAVGRIHFTAGWRDGAYSIHRTNAAITLPDAFAGPAHAGTATDLALIHLDAAVSPGQAIPLPLIALDRAIPPFTLIGYRRETPARLHRQDNCALLGGAPGLIVLSCPVVTGNSGAPVLAPMSDGWGVVAVISARAGGASVAVRPDQAFSSQP